MNRHERRAVATRTRLAAKRPAREPKKNPGPCGVRRYSLRKVTDPARFVFDSAGRVVAITREHAAINVDLDRASDFIAHLLVVVDQRRMGPDRVNGTAQIDARPRVMRQAQRVTK